MANIFESRTLNFDILKDYYHKKLPEYILFLVYEEFSAPLHKNRAILGYSVHF